MKHMNALSLPMIPDMLCKCLQVFLHACLQVCLHTCMFVNKHACKWKLFKPMFISITFVLNRLNYDPTHSYTHCLAFAYIHLQEQLDDLVCCYWRIYVLLQEEESLFVPQKTIKYLAHSSFPCPRRDCFRKDHTFPGSKSVD